MADQRGVDCLSHWKTTLDNFRYHRKRTLDLLESLSDQELISAPATSQSPLWMHFRHIGRVQENYAAALDTGKIAFSPRTASYQGGSTKNELVVYLRAVDEKMNAKLQDIRPTAEIDWFGEPVTVEQHFIRLAEHEILHHGQFIAYMAFLKKDFPESWGIWGLA